MENYKADNLEDDAGKIDNAKNEPKQISPVIYKVRRGDTLQSLARKHHTSAKTLMQSNQLKTSKVFTGQMIKINQNATNSKSDKSINNKKTPKNSKNSARIVQIKSKNIKTNNSKAKPKTKQI